MEVLDSAIRQGIAPAIVVAIYLIITKIIDTRKEKTQFKLSTDIAKSINDISAFVISLTKNIIDKDKEKCKRCIEDSINSSAMRLIQFVTITVVNNHIDINKETILANIHNIVNAEYYNVYSSLSMYKIDDKIASNYLDKKWIKEVEEDMINIIYNNNLNKEDKVVSFSNRLNLKFQSYITYIINNVIF